MPATEQSNTEPFSGRYSTLVWFFIVRFLDFGKDFARLVLAVPRGNVRALLDDEDVYRYRLKGSLKKRKKPKETFLDMIGRELERTKGKALAIVEYPDKYRRRGPGHNGWLHGVQGLKWYLPAKFGWVRRRYTPELVEYLENLPVAVYPHRFVGIPRKDLARLKLDATDERLRFLHEKRRRICDQIDEAEWKKKNLTQEHNKFSRAADSHPELWKKPLKDLREIKRLKEQNASLRKQLKSARLKSSKRQRTD